MGGPGRSASRDHLRSQLRHLALDQSQESFVGCLPQPISAYINLRRRLNNGGHAKDATARWWRAHRQAASALIEFIKRTIPAAGPTRPVDQPLRFDPVHRSYVARASDILTESFGIPVDVVS